MRRFLRHFLLLAALGGAAGAWAQPVSQNEIGTGVLAGAHGRLAVNSSAGIGNVQSNQAALAASGHRASAQAGTMQKTQRPGEAWADAGRSQALIGRDVFSGAIGILTVNQASGHGNAQTNSVAISAAPVAEAAVEHLAGVHAPRGSRSDAGKASGALRGERSAVIADTAFAAAAGVVQINQIAGSGNAAHNAFAMSIGAAPR